MAFTDNTTSLAGKDSLEFFSAALLTGDTKSIVRKFPNVKSKLNVPKLAMSGIVVSDDCVFSDTQTTTLSTKALTVEPLKINLTLCKTTLEAGMLGNFMSQGSNANPPQEFVDYVLEEVAKVVSADTEDMFWNFNTGASPADAFDGLLAQFVADSDVVDVGGTTLSATNILTELGKVYAAIPATVIDDPNLKIFMSAAGAKFYRQYQASVTGGLFYLAANEMTYLGIPIVVSKALPTNDIVAASTDNLWYGFDAADEEMNIRITDMEPLGQGRSLRVTGFFKFGVGYGNGSEIVYYT